MSEYMTGTNNEKRWVKPAAAIFGFLAVLGVYKSHAIVEPVAQSAQAEGWNPVSMKLGGFPVIGERVSVPLGEQPGNTEASKCELFFGVGDVPSARPYISNVGPNELIGRLERKTNSGNVTSWTTDPSVLGILESNPECFGDSIGEASEVTQALAAVAINEGFTGINIVTTPEGKERVGVGSSSACKGWYGVKLSSNNEITGTYVRIEDNDGEYVETVGASPEQVDEVLSDLC